MEQEHSEGFEYPPEFTDALFDMIPKDPYKPCPCGCGKKWRFVLRDGEAEVHIRKCYENFKKENNHV